jgi:hypothetical protein
LGKNGKKSTSFFFLFLQVGNSNEIKKAYLIHINEKIIYKILKKLRELTNNKTCKLHKKTINLRANETDRLLTFDGIGIKNALLRHIGPSLEQYCKKKLSFIENVGYTPARYKVSFSTASQQGDQVLDFALGKTKSLPINSLNIEKNIRFDIPEETIILDDAVIEIPEIPHFVEADLIIRNSSGSRVSILTAKIYSPHYFVGNIPKELVRFRIRTDIFEIYTGTDGTAKFNLNFSTSNKPVLISELANIWRVVQILTQAQHDGFVLEISKKPYDKHVLGINSQESIIIDPKLISIASTVDNYWFLSRQLCSAPEGEVTIDFIMQQHANLNYLRAIFDIELHSNIGVDFIATNKLPKLGEKIAVPNICTVGISESKYVVFSCLIGKVFNREGNKVQIDVIPRLISKREIIPDKNILFREEMDEIYKSLEVEGYSILDMLRFFPES